MDPETATPIEAPAAAAAAAEAPVAPTSMAAAFAAASERSKAAKVAPAETPPPAPAPAPAPEPAKAAKPAAAKAAKADPVEAAAAEVADDPNVTRLPFDDIEEPATEEGETPTTDERVGRRIEKLKGEIKETWKPKVAELEETVKQRDARLAELEAFAKEREDLLERVKTYEAEMSVTKLEKTPAFKKEVAEPIQEIVDSALAIVENYGLDEKKVFAALEEPDKMKRRAALKEASSGLEMDQFDLVDLYNLGDKVQPLMTKRDELYANADKALAELSARSEAETAAQIAARAEERVKATDLVVDRIVKKLPFLSDIVKDVVATAKETNFEALDPQKQAYNVLMGEALPKLAVKHAKLQALYDAALDELAAYSKASPRVDGGLAKTGPGGAQPRTLAEAANMAAGAR